ncbi:ATP-binding protein [Streptomyces pactum]|uniref:ATP-binding protein n=1 Tax=Streptomyces pactum TaxID=68249 RepID=A0ABS0NQI0_9ACTN|nr:ATP-binding protein [Streptomyces pactum]MBH5337446.1 ATP-binding protein [Streptomyces pactum]
MSDSDPPLDAPAATRWRLTLPHTPEAVPRARTLIREVLAALAAPADSDTAELLTSELVANAVEHADGDEPIELVVELLPSGFQVEVHDRDPAPPGELGVQDPHPLPHPLEERGRGLLLIRTLSADSGYRTTPHGKAVWFTLSAPD